jgi:TolA-binding protein
MIEKKPHEALGEAGLDVFASLARREAHGEPPPGTAEQARERALASFRASRRPRATPVVAWLAAAAVAIAIIVAIAPISMHAPPLAFTVEGAPATAKYIPAGATLRFSDGSVATFAAGAGGRVADVGPHGARILLEGGTASFHVVHKPGARWSVEAGPYVIAVVGTVFDVRWSVEAQEIDVRLHEGAVTVNGVPLHAGQRFIGRAADGAVSILPLEPSSRDAAAPPSPKPDREPQPEPAPAPPPSVLAASPPPSASAAPAPLGWPARVAAGDFRGVVADAQARGVDSALHGAPLPDLAALADAARYAGDSDLARRALLAERSRFPGSAEAHAAAFLLGRLADSGGGAAGGAVSWYDTYLAEAPRGAFAAEALGRKLAALRRAHDPGARAVAAEYLQRYPKGPYAASARELTEAHTDPEAPRPQAP